MPSRYSKSNLLRLDVCLSPSSNSLETRYNTDSQIEETSRGRVHIYMSGSAFVTNHNAEDWAHDDETNFPNNTVDAVLRNNFEGKRVYSTKIGGGLNEEFKQITTNFTADNSGSGHPVFYIESGLWTIADIQINLLMEKLH